MDLKEVELVSPDIHWYYQAKLFALTRAVERYSPHWSLLVDVGAGSGFFSRSIANFQIGQHVVCVDPNYETERIEDSGNTRFVKAASSESADIYLFMDVLEHVENDQALLAQYLCAARPGAKVFITVPAFMSMWSAHDDYLEHFRRYRLPHIAQVATSSGLRVIHQRYLFGSIFPLAWVMRRISRSSTSKSDLKTMHPLINAVLRAANKFEHRLWSNRLCGVSAFVVAEVPQLKTEN